MSKKLKDLLPPMCSKHKPQKLGYLADHADADRRMKKGQKQKQCPDCKYWFWKDEY